MILANAWIVTMDDAGTEYERGWLRIESGLVAELGPGDPPSFGTGPVRTCPFRTAATAIAPP